MTFWKINEWIKYRWFIHVCRQERKKGYKLLKELNMELTSDYNLFLIITRHHTKRNQGKIKINKDDKFR